MSATAPSCSSLSVLTGNPFSRSSPFLEGEEQEPVPSMGLLPANIDRAGKAEGQVLLFAPS